MRWIALSLAFLVASAGCGPDPEAEAAAQAAAEAQLQDSLIAAATQALQSAVFDTITWENEQDALDRGQVVYNYSCAPCHGERGLGDAGAVMGVDTIRPPSLRGSDWRFAQDVEAIREYVYLGNADSMPHWGIFESEGGRKLGEKSIDAVARYLAAGME